MPFSNIFAGKTHGAKAELDTLPYFFFSHQIIFLCMWKGKMKFEVRWRYFFSFDLFFFLVAEKIKEKKTLFYFRCFLYQIKCLIPMSTFPVCLMSLDERTTDVHGTLQRESSCNTTYVLSMWARNKMCRIKTISDLEFSCRVLAYWKKNPFCL